MIANLVGLPSAVAVADVNQDRWADIVVTHSASAQVSVILGSESGVFAAPVVFSTGSGSVPVAIAIGDMDGNFTPDLVIASDYSPNGTVRVLLRAVSATPASGLYPTSSAYNVGNAPRSLALADLDRDGKLDVAVANEAAGTVSILRGIAGGALSLFGTYNTGAGVNRLPRSIVAEDFDRDGFIDLAVANFQTSTIGILKNAGENTSVPPIWLGVAAATEISAGSANKPRRIALADFDADTFTDLVIAHENGGSLVSVIRGFGSGAWGNRMTYGTAGAAAFVQAGDIDRDGRPDIVVSNPSGSGSYHRILNSTALPTSSFAIVQNLATRSALDALIVRRITTDAGANIDANLDVIAANSANNKVRIYSGDGNGGFSLSTDLILPRGTQPVSIAIGDLNKNGYVDVVSANYNSGGPAQITVWLKSPTDATYAPGVNYATGNGARAVLLGNFYDDLTQDPDRLLDAVVACAPGPGYQSTGNKLSFLKGNGTGGFVAATDVTFAGISPQPQPWALASGWLDGVDHLDLAVVDRNGGRIIIMAGNGLGGFTPKNPTPTLSAGTTPAAVA